MRFTAPGLPKEFRDRQQAIAPGRVLTWGRTADGVAVGTIGVLAVLGDEDEAIAWHDIVRGGWDADANRLRWRSRSGGERSIVLTETGRLPELLQERVQASIVVQRSVEIAPRRTVIIAGRRDLASGVVDWTVDGGPGVNLADPQTAALASEQVALLRSEYVL
jgi:hypothetical protein